MMLKNFLTLLLCLSIFFQISWAQSIDENRQYFRDHFEKKELYITMRDGVKLFTSVYSPKNKTQSYPMLMMRTPYSCSPYGPDQYTDRIPDYYTHLMKEGYIFVFQDVRGRYMSEGEYVDVRPFIPNKTGDQTDDNSDTYDAIDWLVNNIENNNGRVGIFGISYPGFYSTMSLPEAHPALKAVSPQAPVTDWFIGDDFHHNGAFFLMDAFRFILLSAALAPSRLP
jgi:putative CocE/NonD family hydrolase